MRTSGTRYNEDIRHQKLRDAGINGSWLEDLLVSRKASEDMIDVNTLLIKHPEQSGVSTNSYSARPEV